jgi:SAM-dependent methyltransferase
VTHPDAERWNARYSASGKAYVEDQPRQLLLDHAYLLPKHGLALDAAAGVANNGIYLARRGLHVLALDISKTALKLAVQRAISESLPLTVVVYDLSRLWLPEDSFDVIVNFHFLERTTFPIFKQALKSGGLLIFETFLRLDDDISTPQYYLEPGELLRAFDGFQIIHWKEQYISGTTKVTAQLVARKPVATR